MLKILTILTLLLFVCNSANAQSTPNATTYNCQGVRSIQLNSSHFSAHSGESYGDTDEEDWIYPDDDESHAKPKYIGQNPLLPTFSFQISALPNEIGMELEKLHLRPILYTTGFNFEIYRRGNAEAKQLQKFWEKYNNTSIFIVNLIYDVEVVAEPPRVGTFGADKGKTLPATVDARLGEPRMVLTAGGESIEVWLARRESVFYTLNPRENPFDNPNSIGPFEDYKAVGKNVYQYMQSNFCK